MGLSFDMVGGPEVSLDTVGVLPKVTIGVGFKVGSSVEGSNVGSIVTKFSGGAHTSKYSHSLPTNSSEQHWAKVLK